MLDTSDNGERQVAPTLDGIRRDHVARYEFAAARLAPGSHVIDLACGVGYGAKILADAGHRVLAIDRSQKAIAYAGAHYDHPRINYVIGDASAPHLVPDAFDAAVCFETIEHLADPLPLLRALRAAAPVLIVSVPNEDKFPFRCGANNHQGWAHHHRHYRRDEIAGLLTDVGFRADTFYGQNDTLSEVEPGVEGRTLVIEASRVAKRAAAAPVVKTEAPTDKPSAPHHVAILGLGPSLTEFVEVTKRCGSIRAFCDEVWGINAAGGIIRCDRVFHMDDVKVQELRAAERPDSNIAAMLEWMRWYPGPIYTSHIRPGYPGLVEFPLQEVLDKAGWPYFNSTAAYAVAYARHIGVKVISPFGLDYTMPNLHHGERGRGCVEFWLGLCAASGMEIRLPDKTTLMDANAPDAERFYGFDCFDVTLTNKPDGRPEISLTEKEPPTAEETERRYDHSKPTWRTSE